MQHIALGYTNDDIALELHRAAKTINSHVSAIYERLGAKNRAHAVSLAIFKGVISFYILVLALIIQPVDELDIRKGERRMKRRELACVVINNNIGETSYIPRPDYKLLYG